MDASRWTASSHATTSYQKHNPSMLENANFLPTVMALPDEEIRSKCLARYHTAPEPQRNTHDI